MLTPLIVSLDLGRAWHCPQVHKVPRPIAYRRAGAGDTLLLGLTRGLRTVATGWGKNLVISAQPAC